MGLGRILKSIPERITNTMDDSAGSPTYGVEIEFAVPSIHVSWPDPDPDITDQVLFRTTEPGGLDMMAQVREQLLQTLVANGRLKYRSMADDEYHSNSAGSTMYDCWRLCPDFSVCMDRRHGIFDGPYQWTRCELTSPILNEDNYDTEINTVCSDLKNARIHINKNSAVHVHVGLRGASFSLLTIKKFVTFYWLTEDAFLKLHHPCRHWNKYCFRLTIYSSLATKTLEQLREEEECLDPKGLLLMRNWIPTEGLTELQRARFRRIWGSTRIEEIGYLMGAARRVPVHQAYDRRGSVGFLRFLPRGQFGANINTFEWRQMSSTLDAEHIIQWAEACIFFTDFCRTASEVVFKSHIAKVIEKGGDYSGIELIRDLHANTDILEKKLESWKQDASFCEDKSGAALFVPRSPPYSDSPSGDVF